MKRRVWVCETLNRSTGEWHIWFCSVLRREVFISMRDGRSRYPKDKFRTVEYARRHVRAAERK